MPGPYDRLVAGDPTPNAQTVEALLDTTWRIADEERARTEGYDRKAAAIATFASLLTTLTATLGTRFLELIDKLWALAVFSAGLLLLVLSVVLAVVVLLPKEYRTLGMEYLRRFPTWSEILKRPEDVRGETMRGVIEAIALERQQNDRKGELIRAALLTLLAGLVVIASEAAILGAEGVL